MAWFVCLVETVWRNDERWNWARQLHTNLSTSVIEGNKYGDCQMVWFFRQYAIPGEAHRMSTPLLIKWRNGKIFCSITWCNKVRLRSEKKLNTYLVSRSDVISLCFSSIYYSTQTEHAIQVLHLRCKNSVCSRYSPQPCLDPPKSEWHDGQRQINEAGKCIRKIQPYEQNSEVASEFRRATRLCD